MKKLEALKSLYAALGGTASNVAACDTSIEVLNAILALGSVEGKDFIGDAVAAIAANLSKIDPSPSTTLITKEITANGDYAASSDEADGYSSVTVDVPNTYTAEDNGKVVNNQALVAQAAYPTEITENDTYDTTNYNSITVNVAGGTDFGFSSIPTFNSDGTSISRCCYNSIDGNGTFNVTFGVTTPPQEGNNFGISAILCQPAKKVNISCHLVYEGTIVFTPAEDFDGFYDTGEKLTLTGDQITAGDGKVYEFSYNATQESFVIKAFGNNCTVNE